MLTHFEVAKDTKVELINENKVIFDVVNDR